MSRTLLPLALLLAAATARAQQPSTANPCSTPDSIAVRGNQRVPTATVLGDAGIIKGDTLNFRVAQRAIRNLYATGQFSDVRMSCASDPATGHSTVVFTVVERPILGGYTVSGTKVVSDGAVRGKISLVQGKPLDPAAVTRSVQRIDSLYEAKGYYLARVKPETTMVAGAAHVNFAIDEGRRLAISGVEIAGDHALPADKVVDAMKTKPEGFWWWKKGEFDEDKFAADIGERIPKLYEKNGFIDFQVAKDTLLVDRTSGKGMLRIQVQEGKRYHVGTFEVVGNRHFSTEDIDRFFPFQAHQASLAERVKGLFGGGDDDGQNLFDQDAWDEATNKLRTAYANDGYIYAQIRPVVERVTGRDSVPTVNLRWEIDERTPATINRVEIAGNDYTSEACIRDALVILPGDVFSQDRLIRSYQNIQNLGFFESPLPPPDTRPANDKGDVDVIFHLKEKRTGSINFGASVGQGTGVGGFIGLDQPNLFGACKRASLQWQFGRYINDFQLSYTDPAIKLSRVSGTATAYHTRSRYLISDLGQSQSTGGSLQFGFPLHNSLYTRLFVSYGGEAVKFTGGIASRDTTIDQGNHFRSTLGLTITHDNRIDLPFASAGSMRTFTAQFNGGPLGGTSSFQRYTTELRNYSTLAAFGGDQPGSQPLKLVFGLTLRAGALFGDAGPFFFSQKFAMGGTQYGEQLRGYEEFSITPHGFVPGTNSNASTSSFGNAFFSGTAELGLRFNQMLYTDLFFDAGNVYDRPEEFDPTRLFRGAGIGVSIVTPLGPLGLDWAYGFDRVDQFGRKDPKWQLHFKLGQIF
ncbi:MAG TPA: outer membrane protein assembly factor BamA [Gemmatimonadaceae bacterium]|nr:outer membrane protein assembly factor BamA [Gemmatimonadaceae bacterium]